MSDGRDGYWVFVPGEHGEPFQIKEGEDCWMPIVDWECKKAWFGSLRRAAECGARKASE